MADIKKTGDWDGFAKMLAEAGSKFKANIKKATHNSGRLIQAKVKDRINANQVAPPTSPEFTAWKSRHSFYTDTLRMTGDLEAAIKYENKNWNEGFVGVNRNATGKDGQRLVSIAQVMEYGPQSKPKKGLPKPFIRPVVEQVGKEIAENYQKAIEETFKK
jgi:hypothetical protein